MLRYAGIETLIPTPELQAYVDAHLPASLARYFYAPGGGPEIFGSSPTVPRNTWDASFRPELNCLYWPTGASRWSVMLLLVDSDMLDDIVPLTSAAASVHFEAAGQQLVIADSSFTGTITADAWSISEANNHIALSTEMFALAPHPISDYSGASKTVWILPIVDRRWFWQWKNIGTGPGTGDTTDWDAYYDFFGDKLGGFTINNASVPAIYGDPQTLPTLKYANAATTLDAIARSVGQRVVRHITGEVRTYGPTTATTRWNANTVDADGPTAYGIWRQLAGGSFSYKAAASMPATIRVIEGTVNQAVTAETAGATAWTVGAEATIFTQYPAGEVEADFAEQVATDWVGWRAGKKSDIAFVGVKAWATTGFEDFVAFSHGALGQSPATRIVTCPENLDIHPVSSPNTICERYYRAYTGIGNITGSFGWEIIRVADASVVVSGTYTIGTTDTLTLKAEIDAGFGSGSDIPVSGGPFPGNDIIVECNKDLKENRYQFRRTSFALSPEIEGGYAFVAVVACCG